jgi:hypothetical protein
MSNPGKSQEEPKEGKRKNTATKRAREPREGTGVASPVEP